MTSLESDASPIPSEDDDRGRRQGRRRNVLVVLVALAALGAIAVIALFVVRGAGVRTIWGGDAGAGGDWENAFALASTAIADGYPESFVLAEVTSHDPAVGTILFTGDVPGGLERYLEGVPSYVRIDLVGGSPLSAVEIDELVIEAHEVVSATGMVDSLSSSYDHATGKVEVVAHARPSEAGEPDVAADQIVAALPEEWRDRISLTLTDEAIG